jgi:hypothetical protein
MTMRPAALSAMVMASASLPTADRTAPATHTSAPRGAGAVTAARASNAFGKDQENYGAQIAWQENSVILRVPYRQHTVYYAWHAK